MIGTTEILVISGVIVLLFGATAIPKFFRSMGRAKAEFKKGVKEAEAENEENNEKTENDVSSKEQ